MSMRPGHLFCDVCQRRYGDLPNWDRLDYDGDDERIEEEAVRVWGWSRTAGGGHACRECGGRREEAR